MNRESPSNQPNFSSSNPYKILGLHPNCTAQQIKISYRKLALQYHPDKLSPDATREEREGAHDKFTKIGHAYEILGDEVRRGEFDAELRREERRSQRQEQRSQRDHAFGGRGGFGDSMFDDAFFSSFGGMRNGSHRSAFEDQFHFMDPFELFNQFFSDEMDHMQGRQQRSNRSRSNDRMDPFFGSDPFFSGFGGSMMSRQFDMMNSMNSMMSQMHSGSFGGQQMMMSNSGFGGQSVSTSTRTTIVNGVRTTVTERTVRHPDGRVERHVETTGGDTRHALPSSNGNSARAAIGYGNERRRQRH